jgi:glyoxylase-like metal-dependent hydrolase (beta-lactamase superfamily II)
MDGRWKLGVTSVVTLLVLQACAGPPPAVETQPHASSTAPRVESPVLAELADGTKSVRIDDELSVRRVARDAYVVVLDAKPAPANVLVVRMADGTVILCSSPYDTQATRTLLAWVRETFAPPQIIAVNTHFHPDGTGGNEAYVEAGVKTYASNLTQDLLAKRGAQVRDQTASGVDAAMRDRLERTRIVPAANTFDAREGLTLTLGGETVRVFFPGAAHSPDNVVVHFPVRELLFGGCMIKTGKSIGFTGDADLDHWEAAVVALGPMSARVVVPGHGDTGGPELLENTIEVVRAARAAKPADSPSAPAK